MDYFNNQLNIAFWCAMADVSVTVDFLTADIFDVNGLYMAGGEL